MWTSRGAGRAVIAGGASALAGGALAAVALASDALPASAAALAIPAACAGAVGAAASIGPAAGWPVWRRPDVVRTTVVAVLAGAAAAGWFLLRPALAGLAATGVVTIGDAAFLVPGLLAWVSARRPGAIGIGLGVSALVVLVLVRPPYPTVAFLAIPVVAAPAEAWFLARGPVRSTSRGGLVGAGILLGFASAAATRLLHPGAAVDWESVLVGRAIAGLIAGLAAERVASLSVAQTRLVGLLPGFLPARYRP